MKWIELIMVRSAGSNVETLIKTLQDLMVDVSRSSGSEVVRMYHRERIETDICILLFHSGKKSQTGGSPLGLRIVTAFKEVGLVHHTIWNEMDRQGVYNGKAKSGFRKKL